MCYQISCKFMKEIRLNAFSNNFILQPIIMLKNVLEHFLLGKGQTQCNHVTDVMNHLAAFAVRRFCLRHGLLPEVVVSIVTRQGRLERRKVTLLSEALNVSKSPEGVGGVKVQNSKLIFPQSINIVLLLSENNRLNCVL